MMKALLLFMTCLLSANVHSDEIEFSEEELARETTLPVFEKRQVVLNRHILTDKKFEFAAGFGLEMNEPYYNDMLASVMGTYNMSEMTAINVQGLIWNTGLSSYGEQLRLGSATVPSFNPLKAPHPQWGIFGNYEYVAYYGKLSLDKGVVMNINLFGIAGLGYIHMGATGAPALNLGAGQNFFFTKNFGLRFDLRFLVFQGPDATSQCLADKVLAGKCTDTSTPTASAFSNRMYYNSQIGVAGMFIL